MISDFFFINPPLLYPQLSLFAVCCAVTSHDTPSGQLQSEDQICRSERLKELVTFSRVVDFSAREGFALRMFPRVQSIRALCIQYRLERHTVKLSVLRLYCRLVSLVIICSINPNEIHQESVYPEIPSDLSLWAQAALVPTASHDLVADPVCPSSTPRPLDDDQMSSSRTFGSMLSMQYQDPGLPRTGIQVHWQHNDTRRRH